MGEGTYPKTTYNPSTSSSAPPPSESALPPQGSSESPPLQTSSTPPPTHASNSPPPPQESCSPPAQQLDSGSCEAWHTPVIATELTAGHHQGALVSADVDIGPHPAIVAADAGVEVGHHAIDLNATVHAGLDLGADLTVDLFHGHCG
jgi:hypothetical protein